jgi:hypothetical protein
VLRILSGANKKVMTQSNNTTAEMPKLKVVTTVTTTEQKELELSIPYYFKDKYDNLCKVVDQDYFLSAKCGGNMSFWTVEAYSVKSWKERIATGTPITEGEFETAYDKALMFIQMIKQDSQPSNERDVNEEIDEMRERREAV